MYDEEKVKFLAYADVVVVQDPLGGYGGGPGQASEVYVSAAILITFMSLMCIYMFKRFNF